MNIKVGILPAKDMPEAFAAYIAGSPADCGAAMILVNVEGIVQASAEQDMSFQRVFIESAMHEFGHALDEAFGLLFDEAAIEKAVEAWKPKKYFDPASDAEKGAKP